MRTLPLSLLFLFAAACTPEQKIAQILNAAMTSNVADPSTFTGAVTVGEGISCGATTHRLYGGTITPRICQSVKVKDGKVLCPISIETDLVLQPARDEFEEQKLDCILTAAWEVDQTTQKLKGGGIIESCDVLNYRCRMGTTRIGCAEMQKALQTFTCN